MSTPSDHEHASPTPSGSPCTTEEIASLEAIGATEPVPQHLAQLSRPSVRFSLPSNAKPHVVTRSAGSSGDHTFWQATLGDDVVLVWPGQQTHRIERRARGAGGPLGGHRPSWMDLHYQPKMRSFPPPGRTDRRRRKARSLGDLQMLPDNPGYPWASAGLITTPEGTGTGSLVGRRVVLTASHCVPWRSVNSGNGWWMTFAPNARSLDFNNPTPYGQSYVSDVLYYRQVLAGQESEDDAALDFAVLRLYDPLGDQVGWFGATEWTTDWQLLQVWAVEGYPAGVGPFAETNEYILGGTDNAQGEVLETAAELLSGMSGGPFWAWFDAGGGQLDPRITAVASATPGGVENWVAAGSDLVTMIEEARARFP